MSKGQKKPDVVGLENIGEAVKGLKLKVPKLKLPKTDLEGLGASVEEKLANCEVISQDVANACEFLGRAEAFVSQYQDRKAQKIAKAQVATDVAEMTEYLNDTLRAKDIFYRQAAALAYLKSVLGQDFKSWEDAQATLKDLDERGLLVKTGSDGPIIINYQHYCVNDEFGMDADDIAEISEAVNAFDRLLKQLVRQHRRDAKQEAKEVANITFAEVVDGKNGTCLIPIPPEAYTDRDGQEGWYPGGELLATFTDEEVIPLKGIGSIEKKVSAMVKLGVRLPVYMLDKHQPPGWGLPSKFKRAQQAIATAHGLSDEDAVAFLKKEQALWFLLQRGYKALEHSRKVAEEKEDFGKKSTITDVQAFGLNGSASPAEGTAFMQFEGAFRNGDAQVFDLFFLADFSQDNGSRTIRLTEVPEHLAEVIGGCTGTYRTANDFSECPSTLRRVLRAIRSQVEMAAEIDE